ncbi:MAG: phosphotransferase [Nanoarchaeota archaeon]|nr:phosphotransferase [Nanoarchaeota archaeon]
MITKKHLDDIISQYNVGYLKKYFKVWDKHTINNNIIIETSKGKYLFKLFTSKKYKDLVFYADILHYLRKNGFPCREVIADKDDNEIVQYGSGYGMLFIYIDGQRKAKLSFTDLMSMGDIVAQFHLVSSKYNSNLVKYPNSLEGLLDLCESLAKESRDNKSLSLVSYLKEQSKIKEDFSKNLPKGIVHGDLHKGHFLFKEGEIVGLLDFEYASHDFFINDVGTLVAYNCILDSKLSEKKLQVIISAYKNKKGINILEEESIPLAIVYATVKLTTWALCDFLKKPNEFHVEVLEKRVTSLKYLKEAFTQTF